MDIILTEKEEESLIFTLNINLEYAFIHYISSNIFVDL